MHTEILFDAPNQFGIVLKKMFCVFFFGKIEGSPQRPYFDAEYEH